MLNLNLNLCFDELSSLGIKKDQCRPSQILNRLSEWFVSRAILDNFAQFKPPLHKMEFNIKTTRKPILVTQLITHIL